MREVRLRPEAMEELREASQWYEARAEGLGARFLGELERLSRQVAERPERCALVPRVPARLGLRHARFRTFPYLMVFRDKGAVIEVLALAHSRRKPGYWRSRV